jgi:hypothetical protein
MKAHSDKIKQDILESLKANRSQKEISERTGICIGTIEDWAAEWRKRGELKGYLREGFEFTSRAKNMSNGYYKSIRKRYLGMRWNDKIEKREFGFDNPTEAIHYYLDKGVPRNCAYCGKIPPEGKVWGLDRIDSTLGHVPGNLVPCCSNNNESKQLSCQLSKSKFSLRSWMETNMRRSWGKEVPQHIISKRLEEIYTLAKSLVS